MEHIKIYFTSDVHGYVFPTDYRDKTEKPMGYLNIIQEFKKDGNTLIIDGGDSIQGSPFITYLSNRDFPLHPITQILNEGKFDYITLGNHDFNYGYEYLKKYTDGLSAKCLCANVTDVSNGISILPYDIKVMENGLTVGIIGVTTDFITTWERKDNLINFRIDNTYKSVDEAYKAVRPKVDVLIGIYHGGFEYDLEKHVKLSDTSENIGYVLCKDFQFDILLTGHQHMEIGGRYLHRTFIAQTPENGKKYIEMNITLNNKKIEKIASILKVPSVNPCRNLYEKLLSIENEVQEWLDGPVGYLDTPLHPDSHIEMALKGSYLANFINQVQLEVSGADISCASFGNSVKGFNKAVTVRDIVSTYVYPNTLVILEVTGSQLLQALERSASYFNYNNGEITVSDLFLRPKVEHYNYDYFSNLYYTFDITKDLGYRVISARHKDADIEENKTYTLVMNNYRASGAGGYDFYKEAKVVKEILIEMTELIIKYFQNHKDVVVDKSKYISILPSKKG
jgi:2',3'-cyclic-nucleotide 2'-phosphodiesterase / 3'-nucleotidase